MTTSTVTPRTDASSRNAAPRGADAGRRTGKRRRAATRGWLALFLAPAVALVSLVLFLPFIATVYRSFFSDNGLSRTWVGLQNYMTLMDDPNFDRSLLNTAIWTVGTLLLPVLLGLLIAVGTNNVGWGRVARFAVILPYALSGATTAILWNFMLATDGAINDMFGTFGLDTLQQEWLLEWPMNTIVMIIATTWQATGAAMILFLVGLQSIPSETIEAGRLDGATGLRMLVSVILPQLRPITVVVVGMSLVASLKTFDIVWLLTKGGPGTESETLALTMYRETFTLSRYGYGAAVAVILTIIVLTASWIYLRRQLRTTT
ncbi:sugar ABC transporter permease [Nesterenkonia halophila]|uniref:carbohydrate ABC transporter permease n=1 Tax=Nesterenkonia halophila TaxID=302044 RepID=UPI001291EFA8|nr:sugar ABC transporter permease [Nesterenkonia halophila]